MPHKIADIAYPSGVYTPNGSAEPKTVWTNIGELWEGEEGKHFIKLDTLALNPVIVIQLSRQKKETTRNVLLNCFEPRDPNAPRRAPADDDDENGPF